MRRIFFWIFLGLGVIAQVQAQPPVFDYESCTDGKAGTGYNTYLNKQWDLFFNKLNSNAKGYVVKVTRQQEPALTTGEKILATLNNAKNFITGSKAQLSCEKKTPEYISMLVKESKPKLAQGFDPRCFVAMAARHSADKRYTEQCPSIPSAKLERPCLNEGFAVAYSQAIETVRNCSNLPKKGFESFVWQVGHESGGISNARSHTGALGIAQLTTDARRDLKIAMGNKMDQVQSAIQNKIVAVNQRVKTEMTSPEQINKLSDVESIIQCQSLKDVLVDFQSNDEACMMTSTPPNPLLGFAIGSFYYSDILTPKIEQWFQEHPDYKQIAGQQLSDIIDDMSRYSYNAGGGNAVSRLAVAFGKHCGVKAVHTFTSSNIRDCVQKSIVEQECAGMGKSVNFNQCDQIDHFTDSKCGGSPRQRERATYMFKIACLKKEVQAGAKSKGIQCGTL